MKERLVLHLVFLYLCIVNEDKNLRPHERNFSRPRERQKERGNFWSSESHQARLFGRFVTEVNAS